MKKIYLEWVDSVSVGGWQRDSKPGTMMVKSIGFLIEETKDYITVSTSKFMDSCESPLSIPKCAIRKRRNIK